MFIIIVGLAKERAPVVLDLRRNDILDAALRNFVYS
jgi:hypothetical protein